MHCGYPLGLIQDVQAHIRPDLPATLWASCISWDTRLCPDVEWRAVMFRRSRRGTGFAWTHNSDVLALRSHQRRLLIGGGIALSLVILLRLGAVVALLLDGYRDDRVAEFNRARTAVDALMSRRDAGYVRSL